MRLNKTIIAAVALVATLLFNGVTPSRARADDTAVLVVGSIGLYVVFVAVGAYLTTYRTVPLFLQDLPPEPSATDTARADRVRFGFHCRPSSTAGQPLACW